MAVIPGQLDLLEPVQQAAVHSVAVAALEGRFRAVWLDGERTGCRDAEARAWRLADAIRAQTGESRLDLLDRLVPDDPDPRSLLSST